jgi:hypothetical protein
MKSLSLMMVLLLTGCGTLGLGVTEPVVVDTSCNWAKPILISKRDVLTDGTARQILAHNELTAKNCPAKP